MPDLAHLVTAAAPWIGLAFLAPIFLANALGVLDQSIAVRELAAAGVPGAAASVLVRVGRVLQLTAAPCLFVASVRPYAAVLLAGFLIGATFTAHAFWRTPMEKPGERDRQLANFLKNCAIVGGLLIAAGWSA